METIRIVDLVPYPGGRFDRDGPHSGEAFRDNVLRPKLERALNSGDQLIVQLDGAPGYGSSFLEEAFGGLIRNRLFTPDQVAKALRVVASAQLYKPYEALVHKYIRDATTLVS